MPKDPTPLGRYLEILFERAPDAMHLVDEGGLVVCTNHVDADHPEGNIGRPIEACVPRSLALEVRAAIDAARETGEQQEREAWIENRDGRDRACLIRCTPAPDRLVVVVITDLIRAKPPPMSPATPQEQLWEAQKLEAVGLLSCQIAHDFNNVLTTVLINAHVISSGAQSLQERSAAKEILDAVAYGSRLTSQLKAFCRRELARSGTTNLNGCISDIVQLLHCVVGRNVELGLELHPDRIDVRVDRGQIEQILMNLAVNARDAMISGGRLLVRTHLCTGHREHADGRFAAITVSDTGSGIPPHVVPRIFEPFFTTKASTGTGLGLAIVHRIVRQAGGYIAVTSEVGTGSSFKVCLPLAERPKVVGST